MLHGSLSELVLDIQDLESGAERPPENIDDIQFEPNWAERQDFIFVGGTCYPKAKMWFLNAMAQESWLYIYIYTGMYACIYIYIYIIIYLCIYT